MNSTCENGTECDPQEYDRSPQGALHSTEDRAKSRNIQELYKKQFPSRKDNVVDSVVDCNSRCLTVIRSKCSVDHFTVSKVAAY